jgi:PAT family beta-lactamase induction signal transducer AmpG
VLWQLALASATHDIAADGFYLLALPSHRQAAFVGVRSTCYRLAMITGQGGLVWLAGWLETRWGDVTHAWIAVFGVAAAFFVAIAAYHAWALPRPEHDGMAVAQPVRGITGSAAAENAGGFFEVFVAFFRKPGIGAALAFLLLYRFAEAQLLKLVTPFLLDPRAAGGLGLRTEDVGFVYGTLGVAALIAGGLAGGVAIARFGLKRMLWPMLLAMYVPNLVFIALALAQPASLAVVGAALTVEQFGYGFGFTAYMLYMMLIAEGEHRTAHYAICTGFMALGMMLPGMASGWIQELVGYRWFFVWVCVACLPSIAAVAKVLRLVPAGFGMTR